MHLLKLGWENICIQSKKKKNKKNVENERSSTLKCDYELCQASSKSFVNHSPGFLREGFLAKKQIIIF